MGDVDVLFEVRNFYYLGAYQQCVKEAQKVNVRSDEIKLERDIFLYRAYIAMGKSNIVLSEIPEKSSSEVLKAIRRLALYFSDSKHRQTVFEQVKKEYEDATIVEDYALLINGLILLQGKAYDSAICVFERSELLEAKALAVQSLLKINRVDLALKMLKKMQEIDEDATVTQLCLAWLYLCSGKEKLQDAFYIYQELIDKYGATSNLLISQATTLIMRGKNQEAEALISQAEERDGASAAVLINQYYVYSSLRKSDEILNRTLKQLKLEYPDDDFVKDYVEQERVLDGWVDLEDN
jgi:coatomer protein complex subunit epsilon